MNRRRWFLLFLIILAGGIVWLILTEPMRSPVKIGFASELSGPESDLGIQARNAVEMGIAEINAQGGIAGRPLELAVRNDAGSSDTARQVDQELVDEGVAAIIGHITSAQSLAGLEVTQPAGVVLLSPTSASTLLTGKDDLFFRANHDNRAFAYYLARRIVKEREIKKVAVLYDSDNTAYTQVLAGELEKQLLQVGGSITEISAFSTSGQVDMDAQFASLLKAQPDGLVIAAPASSTALWIQHARLSGWNGPVFVSEWAYSDVLIQSGGKAVEGVELITSLDINGASPALEDFRRRYEEMYGSAPNFAAAMSYESLMILASALQKTGGSPDGLPLLLKDHDYEGLSSALHLDTFGDIQRPLYLLVVKDGQFTAVQTYPDPQP